MKVVINKSIAHGSITPPPSKSYAHRMLIAAALSKQNCIVENIELSNDILATIGCLRTLGKEVEINQNVAKVTHKVDFENLPDKLVFDCLESGSTFRFFIPIALLTGKEVIFKGSKRLIERGIEVYEEIFLKQDIVITKNDTSITLTGKLKGGKFEVRGNVSSQFITGLLFALPLVESDSQIIVTTNLESKNYVDITLDVLSQAGIEVEVNDNLYNIRNSQQYQCEKYIVEADYSNAAFLDAFNYLNGSVILNGLNYNSFQGDKVYKEYLETLSKEKALIDLKNAIDLGPILFCFSALKHGGHFINTSRLKIKESDRVNAVKEELEKFGVELIDLGNEVIINNEELHKPNQKLFGQGDHRIIMALSVMLSVFGGEIEGYEAVAKSYPSFFTDIKKLGIEVEYVKK